MSAWLGAKRVLQGLAALLIWGYGPAGAEGVDFAWRAADLQRFQRAFAAPRTMFDQANAAFDAATRGHDQPAQLTALLDAAAAAAWLPPEDADRVLERIPPVLAGVTVDARNSPLVADLLTYQGLNLVAANRLDEAAAALTRAQGIAATLADPGHRATLEMAAGLLTLLRDDADGALAHLARAYELAVHDLGRAHIMTWQAAISRRASYFYYDLLRTSLRLAKESDRLVPPDKFPALGTINLSVLTQCEAILGEPDDAERHGRQFNRLVAQFLAQQKVDYGDAGMTRLLSQFRRQDIVLAEKLGRRRVLLTWGLLITGVVAGIAVAAVTMQWRQKRRQREISGELASRNTELQELGRSHTRLLAATCHDLREPVHALGVLAKLAQATHEADADAPITDDYLSRIRLSSMKLTDMLSELLDLTRIEGGYYVPDRRVVPLHELLDELQVQFQDGARRLGATLEVVPTALHVRTDPYLLRRILFSVLRRSLGKPGIAQIRVSAVADRHGSVLLRVQDSLADGARDAPLVPADGVSALDGGLTAQGPLVTASVVTQAADLLEISLDVASQPGRGSLIALTLEPAEALAPSAAAPQAAPNDRPQLIALLEDDEDSRQGLATLLQHKGYRVAAAESAEGLLENLQVAGRAVPDLLITDLHLGRLDGLEQAAIVRGWPGHGQLPVMVLTGDQDAAVSRRTVAANVLIGYKPMLPRQLLASIQSAVARQAPFPPLAPGLA